MFDCNHSWYKETRCASTGDLDMCEVTVVSGPGEYPLMYVADYWPTDMPIEFGQDVLVCKNCNCEETEAVELMMEMSD